MAQSKKSRSRKKQNSTLIRAEWPVWYFPDAPLGSAVKYIASLSPHFDWVGISSFEGKGWKQGPSLGTLQQDPVQRWSIEIRDRKGKLLGQIEIECLSNQALRLEEEIIRRVASELGELWPK